MSRSLSRTSLAVLFPLSLLVATASAQRVYVIDGLNRAGTDFTDLPAAEVAAQHGDILDVRADGGVYTPITTSKGLTILCNSAGIRVTRGQPFRVSGLPAGREFVLQRCSMAINQLPPAPLVELVQCAGRVHLQQVNLSNYSAAAALDIVGCAAVTLRDSRLLGGLPALRARNSTVAVSGCAIEGSVASDTLSIAAGEAIALQDSTIHLGGTYVLGGAGRGALPAAPGLTMAGSVATIGGGAVGGRLLSGGFAANSQVPAVRGQASLVRIDPNLPVIVGSGALPFVGVTVVTVVVPALNVSGFNLVRTSFEGDPTALNVTLLGLPADPAYSAVYSGSLWLAPSSMVALPGVFLGYSNPGLQKGLTIGIQIASVGTLGVELSNPAFATVP